ncbi:hypothetical protein OAG86_03030, partial [Akkermansiaceae bacterium]|nr:hypothetical protein [Akkermansiaceae bacterium]
WHESVDSQSALPRSFLAAVLLLGHCFWREGFEAAFGPEQTGEKGFFVPLTINQRKGAKVGQRQIDLANRWHKEGLLSKAGLDAVLNMEGAKR